MPYRRRPWDEAGYQDLVQRACFICEMLAGNRVYAHHIAYRDASAVVFLNRFPSMLGHLLVAPVAHREHVVGDVTVDEYLSVQRLVHAAGTALTQVVPTERLYVLSLGSQQGNRHVHWHIAPLPAGTPYEQQQFQAFATERGYLDVPDAHLAALAAELSPRIRQIVADRA